MASERARVLITVKASPEPSTTYGDTVCVAGVKLTDDGPEWVRIYPVAFRHLQSEQQFHKFEVIEVDLNPSPRDNRKESRRPVWESLTRGPKAGPVPLRARGPILEKLVGPTMCELRAGVEADMTAQSLGLVEVRYMKSLAFEDHGEWTAAQVNAMSAAMNQPDLLGEIDETPMLVPPRYKVKYRYVCMTPSCNGHVQRILDWELNALQYRNRRMTDAELRAVIVTKFHDDMWNKSVRTYLFVGNFADVKKRKNFSVLGVYKPPRASDWSATLF